MKKWAEDLNVDGQTVHKRCSTWLIIREMQIKTTSYHFMWVRMVVIKKSSNNKCWRGCGEKVTHLHCWWECRCKLVQPLWRTIWRLLEKLKIELPCDPALPLLGIYMEKTVLKDTCTPVFIASLFTRARSWKQPKCPSTEVMDKEDVIHMHNGIFQP